MGWLYVFLCSLAASDGDAYGHFDFGDLYLQRAICLRFRDVAMVCILNDACACLSLEKDHLFTRIAGPLSPLQLRKVMARLGYLNTLIKERPSFHSTFSEGEYKISGTHPDVIDVGEWDPSEYGRILYFACKDQLTRCPNPNIAKIEDDVRNGRYTFLFDENGDFLKQQTLPIQEEDA